jgi:hypothetical protein
MFRTELEFTLPRGYIDEEGNLHREGVMRLSTAADEILPLEDPRVERNPAYLLIILLSRVVIKLGKVHPITPQIIEGLFTEDLTFLQNFYNEINGNTNGHIPTECPKCHHRYEVETMKLGELQATP